MNIKLVISDIDGVWTDGGMYYDQTGNEWKKFCTSDSAGVIFCRLNNIEVAIITGEETNIVERRAQKLGIEKLFQGCKNKLSQAKKLLSELNITFDEVAYIGDDMMDIPLLKSAGFSATVPSAPAYVKDVVDYITTRDGGEGAFREFVEKILIASDILDDTVDKFVRNIT